MRRCRRPVIKFKPVLFGESENGGLVVFDLPQDAEHEDAPNGGIAIHGSEDVPAYPASHGCIRIPMFASQRLTSMVPKGTPVYVYGCKEEQAAPVQEIAAKP